MDAFTARFASLKHVFPKLIKRHGANPVLSTMDLSGSVEDIIDIDHLAPIRTTALTFDQLVDISKGKNSNIGERD